MTPDDSVSQNRDSESPRSQGWQRGLAFLAIMVITALALEGLLSITTGQSLLRRAPQVLEADFGFDRVAPSPPTDTEQEQAARKNPGPYWLHPDPRVGLVLRPNSQLPLARAKVRTGPLGMRLTPQIERPGDAVSAAEPLRIAVVGASIPFGLGVSNGETLAARLQALFLHTPVEGLTVAAPMWSYRNAVHFILDHWAELDPDIVLYMPFANDLGDTPIVNAAGHRTAWGDAFNPNPLPPVDLRQDVIWKRLYWGIRKGRLSLTEEDLGTLAIEADLSPESMRRYEENAAALDRLARHCQANGARMALLMYQESAHEWHLFSRFLQLRQDGASQDVPIISFFERVDRSFQLDWNPHPNGQTYQVLALWTARELVDLGWLESPTDAAWPDTPRSYDRLRSGPWSADQIHQRSAAARERSLALATDRIDFVTGHGMKQVMAGLSTEGTASTGLLAMLRRGRVLEIVLDTVGSGSGEDEDLDIYPLEVAVRIDGQAVGSMTLPLGGQIGRFAVPKDGPLGGVMEVRLLPSDWGVVEQQGARQVASFRPVRLTSLTMDSAGVR